MKRKGKTMRAGIHVHERIDRLSECERQRMLEIFDMVVPGIPDRPAADVDAELAAIRHVRRKGGRRNPPAQPR